jgi:predicted RNA polymerase sigma factor
MGRAHSCSTLEGGAVSASASDGRGSVRPRLIGTLSLASGDAGVAEELTQEALARVWVSWPKLHELDEPAATAWALRTHESRRGARQPGRR